MSDVFSELINLGREQSKEQRSWKSRVRRISSGDDEDNENTDSQSKCSVTKGEEQEKYESDRPTGVLSDRPTLQQEQEADLDTTFDSDATHMPESENEDRVIVPETQFLTDADVSEVSEDDHENIEKVHISIGSKAENKQASTAPKAKSCLFSMASSKRPDTTQRKLSRLKSPTISIPSDDEGTDIDQATNVKAKIPKFAGMSDSHADSQRSSGVRTLPKPVISDRDAVAASPLENVEEPDPTLAVKPLDDYTIEDIQKQEIEEEICINFASRSCL